MKSILVLSIALFSIQISFAQKAKAFEKKSTVQTVLFSGGSVSLSAKEQMKAEVTKSHSYSTNTIANSYLSKCPQCKQEVVVNRTSSKQASKAYTCGMHPASACKEGICPVCKV